MARPEPSVAGRRAWRGRSGLLVLVLVGALLAGCGDDAEPEARNLGELIDAETAATSAALDEPGEWTMFVYLAADNDLEPFALVDLEEMTEAEGVEMVVLVDRSPSYTSQAVLSLGDFDDTKMLHIVDGEVEVVEELGELDTGDPAVLEDFVADGLSRYGSERNGLVIWNHGASWPGAAIDETSLGSMLSVDGIRDAVRAGLDRADVERFDILGFDACLMATYEVAQNLAPVARTLLASEELEPGHGWNWSAVSAPGGTTSTLDLASGIIDGYAEQASSLRTSGVTLSLVDLDLLDPIDEAFDDLAASVDPQARGLVGRIGSGRAEALGFGRDPDPTYDSHMVDVGHLATLLADIDALAEPAGRLRSAIDDAVLLNVTDSTTVDATGLAVYFPPVPSLGLPSYEDVADIGPWTGFLRAYYTGAEEVPPDQLPAFLDDDRLLEAEDVESTDDGVSFTVDVVSGTGVNIVSSKLFWGQVDMADTNRVAFFGERLATIDGDTITAEYDWRYLVVEDGTNEASAYSQLDLAEDGSIRRIVVPVSYTSAEGTTRGILALGIDGDQIASETFYRYTDEGTVGEIEPAPGDTFVPQLLVQDMDDLSSEWVASTDVALSADVDALDHHLRRLAFATPVMLELNLTDIEGGTDYIFHGTASP
ncbi:clostripain-related cysteine peptidase [Actinomarinicola tropica]|uniref:Peptidase C11 n=1 Tax=Actinomarinicola tropica TaxID=2789776 RepID=A0A5Q2RGG3_9ACTN|nr:clostripain-related cysteine peptidase [Actinomarinicola tropica]QGG95909.1 hypothetical protein GH723_12830 [Actinomarinicola tropica]